jgi:cytochrome bd-type quinol oxidase subunit 2
MNLRSTAFERLPPFQGPLQRHDVSMKTILPLFTIAYAVVAGLFGIAGVVLMGIAFLELWAVVIEPEGQTLPARAAIAIESIGLVAVALVALEMAQTVAEEEVVRRVHVSAPTRVRRYLSRFLVVVVVALGIESLVAVVQALHERPELLPSVAIGAAALLAAWGVFVRLNRAVEELEPQGIPEARAEDHKVQ